MTALDQAFIKAFTRQNTVPLAALPRAAAPASKQQPGPREEDACSVKHEMKGAASCLAARAVADSCTGRQAASSVQTESEKWTTEEKTGEWREESAESPIWHSTFSIQPPSSSPQPRILSPTVPLSVWAALENPPRAAASLLKVEGEPEARQKVEESEERGARIEEVISLAPSPEPRVVSPEIQAPFPESCVLLPLQPAVCEAASDLTAASNDLPEEASAPSPEIQVPPPETLPSFAFVDVVPTTPVSAKREFKPVWQVNHFTWPKVCRRLIARAAEELDRLADALLAMNAQGKKVLAIGSCRRGEGATTLLLCAARRLAERGIKSVLVDADLGRPRLAKRLGVQPQFGWDETTEEEGKSLDQAIVEATANNLSLLPAREPPAECGRPAGDPSRLASCLATLRNHYDLVLVDLGPLEDAGLANDVWTQTLAGMIDAVILVQNHRITSEEQLTAFGEQLAAAGIAAAGIVENFAAED